VTAINNALSALVGAALSPFERWPPIVGLSAVSLLVAIAMLLVARATTDQAAIIAVKRRMQAALFEIRLFNDDIRAVHSGLDMLRQNLTYARLSLAPLPWLAIPLALLTAQLHAYYGYDGFVPGQTALVEVRLTEAGAPAAGDSPALALVAPRGIDVQTPMLWIPSERETVWRIGFEAAGDYELVVTLDGAPVTKRVTVSSAVGWRAPERLEAGVLNQFLAPVELSIEPGTLIESIAVNYPQRVVRIGPFGVDWLGAFFALSLFFAWLLRKPLGVTL